MLYYVSRNRTQRMYSEHLPESKTVSFLQKHNFFAQRHVVFQSQPMESMLAYMQILLIVGGLVLKMKLRTFLVQKVWLRLLIKSLTWL